MFKNNYQFINFNWRDSCRRLRFCAIVSTTENAGSNRPQSGAGPNARRIEEETDDFRGIFY
jgi:hypothetical protein